ncbi:hypothetical protein [Streptomyces swartbergensis]|uniref:hypothetical protein n=1 Tax=Streptomyces swartbergensis TaxID=487165 RepID=UPI0037F46046
MAQGRAGVTGHLHEPAAAQLRAPADGPAPPGRAEPARMVAGTESAPAAEHANSRIGYIAAHHGLRATLVRAPARHVPAAKPAAS